MIDDSTIHALVVRLARPDAAGGHTVERAAMLAEGSDFAEIEAWILKMGGEPQTSSRKATGSGLWAERDSAGRARAAAPPQRYVFPANALQPVSA
ncbi:hypothetical protein [Conexibacter woesei]|uniref:Uncharacterized protein n=1 Tax=Conexibacter woesei (strain DSM 14684 / CCUG 47730 / CIP 108061 / JCM 11494 / NBRC 100937 / ID131577) TaxID=469383 RepID=D3FCT0_CONWI|nr:hypothetical protein [Conexibacter woesei]ADB51442.1 hypothetical protein Cwoe_3023 [Conexibacter woesei DSM 14684]